MGVSRFDNHPLSSSPCVDLKVQPKASECDEAWITREMVRARMLHFAAHDSQGAVLSLWMWFCMRPKFKTHSFRIEWFISYDFTTPYRKRDF